MTVLSRKLTSFPLTIFSRIFSSSVVKACSLGEHSYLLFLLIRVMFVIFQPSSTLFSCCNRFNDYSICSFNSFNNRDDKFSSPIDLLVSNLLKYFSRPRRILRQFLWSNPLRRNEAFRYFFFSSIVNMNAKLLLKIWPCVYCPVLMIRSRLSMGQCWIIHSSLSLMAAFISPKESSASSEDILLLDMGFTRFNFLLSDSTSALLRLCLFWSLLSSTMDPWHHLLAWILWELLSFVTPEACPWGLSTCLRLYWHQGYRW